MDGNGEIRTTVRQNLIPALNAGLIDTSTPGHGQLFPQPRLSAPRPGALLDDLTGPVFRLVALDPPEPDKQIGRASCRERVCQYVYISVVAVSLKNKNKNNNKLTKY